MRATPFPTAAALLAAGVLFAGAVAQAAPAPGVLAAVAGAKKKPKRPGKPPPGGAQKPDAPETDSSDAAKPDGTEADGAKADGAKPDAPRPGSGEGGAGARDTAGAADRAAPPVSDGASATKPGEAGKAGDSSKPGGAAGTMAPPAGGASVEEVTDFDEEEKKLDQRIEQTMGKPPRPATNDAGGASGPGFKFIVDLLLQHTVGQKNVSFFPNHTMAILMVSVTERVSLQMHIAPDPAFYELLFAVTPTFNVKVGKLLVPFGTNNFHHIIGGRVDQASRFLPETWSDYGVAVNHLVVDRRALSLEYDAYVVNGFGGGAAPQVGVGTVIDNNFAKGLGLRVTATFPKGIRLVGSAYHSLWDVDNSRGVLFYAVGGALPPGAINLPVLDRLGLRGEWSRGELQYLTDNVQAGLTPHAVARAGFYGEALVRLTDLLMLRVRLGRLNGDNTVADDSDVDVLEPAIIIGNPKLFFLVAWQLTKTPGRTYSMTTPADVLYAKVFLQY